MRRNKRFATLSWHQREMRRDDPSAARAHRVGDRLQSRGKRSDSCGSRAASPVSPLGVDEVALQINKNERQFLRMCEIDHDSCPFENDVTEPVDACLKVRLDQNGG